MLEMRKKADLGQRKKRKKREGKGREEEKKSLYSTENSAKLFQESRVSKCSTFFKLWRPHENKSKE